MPMCSMRHVLPALVAIATLAPGAWAGTVLETVNKDIAGAGQGNSTTTTWAQGGRMRIDIVPGDSIIVFKDEAIYNINKKDKTYIVMDRAAMKRMADQINPAMQQMQEQLAQMPPEQRAQMEKMMGGRMPGAASKPPAEVVRKTARTGKVAGYACNYVEVLEGGTLEEELCVANPAALKGGQELMESAKKMSAMLREMLNGVDAPWLKQMMENQAKRYDEIGGIPVQTRHFANGKPVMESTLKAIRSETLPASTFDVPAGFTKKDMMPQR